MPEDRAPPPPPPACLVRRYPSSQKGGTLIAADVHELETHRERLASGAYRPPACPRCQHEVLHVHDYRSRVTQLVPGRLTIPVVRFGCAEESCGACFQVLPAFVARLLWFNWPLVEEATVSEPGERAKTPTRRPSGRTRRRWRSRLASSAREVVVALAAIAEAPLVVVARALGLDALRIEVVAAIGRPLSALASLIHHLAPGLRLV